MKLAFVKSFALSPKRVPRCGRRRAAKRLRRADRTINNNALGDSGAMTACNCQSTRPNSPRRERRSIRHDPQREHRGDLRLVEFPIMLSERRRCRSGIKPFGTRSAGRSIESSPASHLGMCGNQRCNVTGLNQD